MIEEKRPTWDESFMEIAHVVSKRSTCLRRKSGAVLVTKMNRVIGVGYNGAPSHLRHCAELGGCLRQQMHVPSGHRFEICRAVHAEQNAILTPAIYGASTRDTTLYVTIFPCVICAKLIVQAGIIQVVFQDYYGDEKSAAESMKIFNQAGTQVRRLKE